jgi:hypothetical protein
VLLLSHPSAVLISTENRQSGCHGQRLHMPLYWRMGFDMFCVGENPGVLLLSTKKNEHHYYMMQWLAVETTPHKGQSIDLESAGSLMVSVHMRANQDHSSSPLCACGYAKCQRRSSQSEGSDQLRSRMLRYIGVTEELES